MSPRDVMAAVSERWRNRYPYVDLVVAPVVLDEGTSGVGERPSGECTHSWADPVMQPWRLSGDPGPQVPAIRKVGGIKPEGGRVIAFGRCLWPVLVWGHLERAAVPRGARIDSCLSGLLTGRGALWSWRKKRPGCWTTAISAPNTSYLA